MGCAWDSSGGIFLLKVLGDVFQVLVLRQEWYCHPAGFFAERCTALKLCSLVWG